MLDDGSILFSANCVYVYSLYAQTVIFSIGTDLIVNLNFGLVTQTQSGACAASLGGIIE